jgi:uncharacterized membrane-anchored protein YjiN (DUF445 family)
MDYRKKANITLSLVAIGFILTSVLMYFYNGNQFIRMLFYIVEAALIGGMADWFAVTAIFKKPLGFPFHTAIIPKNRVTIVNSVVNIVEKEFLSAELIEQRLEKVNITSKIIKWIDSKQGKEYIKTGLIKLLRSLDSETYEKVDFFLKQQLIENTKNIDFNKYIQNFFEESIKDGKYKKILELFLDDIIKVAEGPNVRNKILDTIEAIKAEKTQGFLGSLFNSALQESNMVNIPEISDSIHMHLIEALYELKKEDSEDAKFLLGAIEEHLLLNGFKTIDQEVIETLKEQIINDVMYSGIVNSTIESIITELEAEEEGEVEKFAFASAAASASAEIDTGNSASIKADNIVNIVDNDTDKDLYSGTIIASDSIVDNSIDNTKDNAVDKRETGLIGIITRQIEKTWISIKNNDEFVNYIEKKLKESINILIQREHSVIGKIARDTLDSFDDDALNKFIEDRAGNDLQWIRINGSIVGGMVGLLVFLFLTYFYDPIAVPFIKSLL